MRIKNTCLEIDFTGCDRIVAVLVGENGKIYEGDTHLECFHDYLTDLNIKSHWNITDWNDEEKVSEITHSLFKDEYTKLYGFDVWTDRGKQYLIPHFRHNLEQCFDIIQEYIMAKNYILGIYKDFHTVTADIVTVE